MKLTDTVVRKLEPSDKDQFVRCEYTRGFGVKVSPTGRKTFFAEGRVRGAGTARKAIGTYPVFSSERARKEALTLLQRMQQGTSPKAEDARIKAEESFKGTTLRQVFGEYLETRSLKPKTAYDYRSVMNTVFEQWQDKPIASISRNEVLKHFTKEKDLRGHATANKAFRMLSALCNYAKADELNGMRLLTENPVDVLKEKRIPRSNKPRETYLLEADIHKLIEFSDTYDDWFAREGARPQHRVTSQGMHLILLLLYTGLRRSEGLGLLWEDVDLETKLLIARDTKNNTDHSIPLSQMVVWILKAQKKNSGETPWVFPNRNQTGPMVEPKSQLKAICDATGLKFTLHDLRRTFATHAHAAGVDFESVRKAMNHKSGGSITSSYIIRNVEVLRPVFDKIWEQFWEYHDPGRFDEYKHPENYAQTEDDGPPDLGKFLKDRSG